MNDPNTCKILSSAIINQLILIKVKDLKLKISKVC